MPADITLYSKEINIFLSLCETQSLKQTAAMFELSQSAASRQLSKLENAMGVTLFDRSRRPMSLTAEGRALEHELRPWLIHAQQALVSIRKKSLVKQELRIGFVESLTYCVAPEFLARIENEVGHITCLTGSSDRLIERLKANELDIIMTSYDAPDLPGLRRLFFMREPSVAVLPKSLSGKHPTDKWTWSQLATCGIPYIEPYAQTGSGILSNSFLKTIGMDFACRLAIDNLGVKVKVAEAGKGWFITRTLGFLNHEEIIPSVTVVPVPPPGICRELYLVGTEAISRELFVLVFNTLVDIMNEKILPRIHGHFPWLEHDTVVAPKEV